MGDQSNELIQLLGVPGHQITVSAALAAAVCKLVRVVNVFSEYPVLVLIITHVLVLATTRSHKQKTPQ